MTAPAPWTHGPLKASPSGRYLLHADGTPFFFLGDTAWEMADRALPQEIEPYIKRRAEQQFNVLLFVCYSELGAPDIANASGHLPVIGGDPSRPNPAYFEHVDFIIDTAARYGMYVAMLPAWGSWVDNGWLTADNIEPYAVWLGQRYRDKKNIIWIIGGDRHTPQPEIRSIWHRCARGVAIGVNGREDYRGLCMSSHPRARSSHAFHNAPWLTFNMMQSAHWKDRNLQLEGGLLWDYFQLPAKPCMDAEPVYEDIVFKFWQVPPGADPKTLERCNSYYTRKPRYTGILAGGCGTVYGSGSTWQWYTGRQKAVLSAAKIVTECLELEGAGQMRILRSLFAQRPWHKIIPSTDWYNTIVITGQDSEDHGHIAAATSDDRSFAMVYSGEGTAFSLAADCVTGAGYRATWFDPRTGAVHDAGSGSTSGKSLRFTPPTSGQGCDWMLVIDSSEANYGVLHSPE